MLLLDWGLAKVWDASGVGLHEAGSDEQPVDTPQTSITGQGNLQGTITYMSPEQIRRDPNIDFRTDIYSLGVLLYEILAGRAPHVEDTVHAMTSAVADVKPEKPSAYAKWRIPPLLETLAMKCIEKQPDERIQSCSEVVRLLQEDW